MYVHTHVLILWLPPPPPPQGCQLSRIERETHAFHPISPESHALTHIYGNISRQKKKVFIFYFLLVIGLWCTKGTPTMCLLYENGCQNFWGPKKKSDRVPPPPPPPPAHQLCWELRDIYRLRADGPRISHAEPSSKVGSPAPPPPPTKKSQTKQKQFIWDTCMNFIKIMTVHIIVPLILLNVVQDENVCIN